VLFNLALNARDAMPRGGALRLEAAVEEFAAPNPQGLAPGSYVRIRVTDGGEGMDAATLARAAEPFFTTKEVGQGSGLGLSMAHGFAAQSGGALRIESTPGQGTVVTLWLPEAAAWPVAAAAGG
jgi:signal transduction histidine kinase